MQNYSWIIALIFVAMAGFAIRQRKNLKIQKKILDINDPNSQLNRSRRTGSVDPEFGLLSMPEQIKCPHCAEFVSSEAQKCRYCSGDITERASEISNEIQENVLRRAKALEARENQINHRKAESAAKRAAFLKSKKFKVSSVSLVAAIVFFGALNSFLQLNSERERNAILEVQQSRLEAILPEVRSVASSCAVLHDVKFDIAIVQSDAEVEPQSGIRIKWRHSTSTQNPMYYYDSSLMDCMTWGLVGDGLSDLPDYEQTVELKGLKIFQAEYDSHLAEFMILVSPGWKPITQELTMKPGYEPIITALKSCNADKGYFFSGNVLELYASNMVLDRSVKAPPSLMTPSQLNCVLESAFEVSKDWANYLKNQEEKFLNSDGPMWTVPNNRVSLKIKGWTFGINVYPSTW